MRKGQDLSQAPDLSQILLSTASPHPRPSMGPTEQDDLRINLYIALLATVALVALCWAVYEFPVTNISAGMALLSAVTIFFGSSLRVQLPGTEIHLTASDAMVFFVMLTFGGEPVVLSSNPSVESNYPVAAIQDAFEEATAGELEVTNGSVTYTASATLLSMRQFNDVYAGASRTVQTWLITAVGEVPGPRTARVEASAIIERQALQMTFSAQRVHAVTVDRRRDARTRRIRDLVGAFVLVLP